MCSSAKAFAADIDSVVFLLLASKKMYSDFREGKEIRNKEHLAAERGKKWKSCSKSSRRTKAGKMKASRRHDTPISHERLDSRELVCPNCVITVKNI